MFCGLCRKGVAEGEGIATSELKKKKESVEKGVLAIWWLGFVGGYCALLFIGMEGMRLFTPV